MSGHRIAHRGVPMRPSFAALSCMSTKHAGTWAKKGEGSFTSPFWWRPLLADVTGTRQAYEACICRDRRGRGRIPVSTSTTIPSHSHVKSTKGDTVTCGTLSVVNPPCLSLGIGRDDANFGGCSRSRHADSTEPLRKGRLNCPAAAWIIGSLRARVEGETSICRSTCRAGGTPDRLRPLGSWRGGRTRCRRAVRTSP